MIHNRPTSFRARTLGRCLEEFLELTPGQAPFPSQVTLYASVWGNHGHTLEPFTEVVCWRGP